VFPNVIDAPMPQLVRLALPITSSAADNVSRPAQLPHSARTESAQPVTLPVPNALMQLQLTAKLALPDTHSQALPALTTVEPANSATRESALNAQQPAPNALMPTCAHPAQLTLCCKARAARPHAIQATTTITMFAQHAQLDAPPAE
jgi:hypothetical protein